MRSQYIEFQVFNQNSVSYTVSYFPDIQELNFCKFQEPYELIFKPDLKP